jgi:uncharacterized membrane protein YgdD (TMEM256/DUF423 family)
MERTFTITAAAFMFVAVAAGAFGAHALASQFERQPELKATYDTAVRYHMIHALALLGVAWASGRWPVGPVTAAGVLFIAGIVVFSGSLYLLSLTGARWLGAVTPVGGLAFLAGWLSLLLGAWRS